MRQFIPLVLALYFAIGIPASDAFDGDRTINNVDLSVSTFVDLKASQFRQSLRQQWFEAENGISTSGASLDSSRLALLTEIRLKQSLSDSLDIRVKWLSERFYAEKPLPAPKFEISMHPWATAAEFSVVGAPAFDKRQSDLGVAVTLGERPRNFLRVEWLEQDRYYNQKNIIDSSRYLQYPNTTTLEGNYWFGQQLHTHFSVERSYPLLLVFDDGVFQHKSDDINLALNRHIDDTTLVGISYRYLTITKSLSEDSMLRNQDTRYDSLDLFWSRLRAHHDEINAGIRFDEFDNHLNGRDLLYNQRVWQTYVNYHREYAPHKAWELGLYLGDVREIHDYLAPTEVDRDEHQTEVKLRMGWEYHSSDQQTVLVLQFSLDLDDFKDDPGDGGAMSYQMIF